MMLIASLLVLWNYEPIQTVPEGMFSVRDVLEVQTSLGGPWQIVPGPYQLTADRKDYVVDVGNEGIKFFRVRRDWGSPWLVP